MVQEFELRDDGIWVSADGLTDLGRAALNGQLFKFTSFVADPKDVEKLDGNRIRVMAIESVGFTNAANGKDLLVPITNRAGARPSQSAQTANPRAAQHAAASRITEGAIAEQRAAGGSLASCYLRVMNREKTLSALALDPFPSACTTVKR